MTEEKELGDKIDQLIKTIGDVAERKNAQKAAGATSAPAETDGLKALADQAAALDAQLTSLKQSKALADARDVQAGEQERIEAAVKAALKNNRLPSMAGAIGAGATSFSDDRQMRGAVEPHPALKALFKDYRAGELLTAMLDRQGIGVAGFDSDLIPAGKAALASLGIQWGSVPEASKATLGTTGATGGYVLPNNLVDTLIKPATQGVVYQNLVTVRNGVNVRGVDMPYRTGAPARMTFQDWGSTKENVNETYGSYSAILGTIGRVYDISKQYARFSAGSAEQDVMDELTKAAILAENYYIIGGASVTGTVGVGDPTYGVYTALNTFAGAYKTTFSSASVSTLAGSFANALIQGQGTLAGRNRTPSAWVCDSTTYFTAIGEGSDTAGFWNSPEGPVRAGLQPGFGRTPSGGLSYWGIPVYYDSNLASASTTKIVIGAEWDVFKLFRGMEFRIDVSDQAGTRWDQNLIGYRGEEEFGFHAGSGVLVGAAQLIVTVIP